MMSILASTATIVIWCTLLSSVYAARILGIFHTHAYSHYIFGETLMKGLAARGHQVTMVSPYAQPVPVTNYTDVHLDGLKEIVSKNRPYLNKGYKTNQIQHILNLYDLANRESQLTFHHPQFKKLLASNQTFDLVIIDLASNYFYSGLCHHYRAPCVYAASAGVIRAIQIFSGLHLPISYVPGLLTPFTDQMTYLQRVWNTLLTIIIDILEYTLILPKEIRLYKKYFCNVTDFYSVIKNISLILANSHIAVETPRPILPIIKQVGGMHVQKPKTLPQDLQEFLDDAKEGVIYFSLGSNLRSTELSSRKIIAFINVFSKLKQNILWKWEEDKVPAKLNNVKFKKWIPQSDVLAHPNVKLFITHGGLLSFIEAVVRAVPIVGIPVFADQFTNIATAVHYGYGQQLLMNDVNEDAIFQAITEVLYNPKYARNIRRGSQIINDQPVKPLDNAIFWVEHILKYNGGKHMRASVVDFPIYKVWMLDVCALLAIIVIATIALVSYCSKVIYRNVHVLIKRKME